MKIEHSEGRVRPIRTLLHSAALPSPCASTLIIFGLILGFADRVGRSEKDLSTLSARDGILYGLAQSMALIPGVSRSGATIALGRFLRYKREAALRYSFLLALPAVFGSGLYELKKAMGDSTVSVYSMPEILIATITAFIIGNQCNCVCSW